MLYQLTCFANCHRNPQVCFYNSKTEEVSSHTLRLPKEGCVGDLLAELQRQLGEERAERPLRLLEISYSRIYKVQQHVQWCAAHVQCCGRRTIETSLHVYVCMPFDCQHVASNFEAYTHPLA